MKANWNGVIDEVAIYKEALSPEKVRRHYAARYCDWDQDGKEDGEDWGVALTFDMHPSWEATALWTDSKEETSRSILALLEEYEATATFFVSGFAKVATDTSWRNLLTDVVNDGHEIAWHGREHIDVPLWKACSGLYPAQPGQPDPDGLYVKYELFCDARNYDDAPSPTVRENDCPLQRPPMKRRLDLRECKL